MLSEIRTPFRTDSPRAWTSELRLLTIAAVLNLSAVQLSADDQSALPTTDPPSAPLTVIGFVQDAHVGKPIEGARVLVRQLASLDGDRNVIKQIETQTDADGKYAFTIDSSQPWSPPALLRGSSNGTPIYDPAPPPGYPVQIEARHPNYATRQIYETIHATEPPLSTSIGSARGSTIENYTWQKTELTLSPRRIALLELRPGQEVFGVLQSPDGKPLAGVKVVAHSQVPRNERSVAEIARRGLGAEESRSFLPIPVQETRDETITDDEGRFRLSMITPGEGLLSFEPDKDYAPLFKVLYDRRGDVGLVGLQRGAKISGRLVDLDGQPLAEVQISASPWDDSVPKYSGNVDQRYHRDVLTGADGNFTMLPLPPGDYRIEPKGHFDGLKVDENGRRYNDVHQLPGIFVPQKLSIVDGREPPPIEIRALPTVTVEGRILSGDATNQALSPANLTRSLSLRDNPTIQGTTGGMTFRTTINIDNQGNFSTKIPRGLSDTIFEMYPIRNNMQPQWRLGAEGPLQTTQKIRLGRLDRDFKNIEIEYSLPATATARGRAAAAAPARAAQPARGAAAARGAAVQPVQRGAPPPTPNANNSTEDPE